MTNDIGGIYPVLYSFFNEDGTLNRTNFQKQIEHSLRAGVHGVAVLGLITEVGSLTPDERRTLIDWTTDAVAGEVPVAVTIAGRTVAEQRELAQYAQNAGASWMIFQPPLGVKPTSEELLEFYVEVMEGVEITTGIQNAPEYIGCGLEPKHMIELARLRPNFKVMKGEGPVVTVKPYVDQLAGQVSVFNGRGGLELYDNLKAGCVGLVPAPDCADVQVQLYNAFVKGDFEQAQDFYEELLPYAVFSMQSIHTAIYYGKHMYTRRIGLENASTCRSDAIVFDPFFIEAGQTWLSRLGPYRVAP
ncbi:dihydrodipicolinate synthase family protein [Pseudovibrio flavus]|uniref:dihydrodipicolinate synthase family protein n=1 Tax=Pseudovibrio flavus TaxID=2529854 RepID=UPI00211CB07C|nr:dihydrodipicolinate synthase family protein [Pseudovibrio flavus]